MRKISEMNMLLRAQVVLPGGVKLATQEFLEDWNFVRSVDSRKLERKVRRRGWHLIKAAGALLGSGVGESAQAAIACGLKLALRRVNRNHNAVEIEHIGISQYPWFFLAKVRVYVYRIQDHAAVSSEDAVALVPRRSPRKKVLPGSVERFPQFGGALPLMKEIFISPAVRRKVPGNGVAKVGGCATCGGRVRAVVRGRARSWIGRIRGRGA